MRKLTENRLIIASHNDGKIKEINDLVSPYGIDAIAAKKFGLNDPEETGLTFAENAKIKAEAAARGSTLPALADDFGLEVVALGRAPGIYSARWAGEPRDFYLAMTMIEEKLREAGSDDRTARFVCALCLYWPDGHSETFEGEVWGKLTFPPRGKRGFGYDPIFVPDGYDETFGEMDPAEKHRISHRADAFARLKKTCLD